MTDDDAESCSVRARSEGSIGKTPSTSSHTQSLSSAMVTTTSLTTASSVMTSSSVMKSLMMAGDKRGGISGEGRDGSVDRAEAVHEGSEESSKVNVCVCVCIPEIAHHPSRPCHTDLGQCYAYGRIHWGISPCVRVYFSV